MQNNCNWIKPTWPAPSQVKAFSTVRTGGVSAKPFDSFNLGNHVGDDPRSVAENRNILSQGLRLPETPRWINQVHGTDIIDLENYPVTSLPNLPNADASISFKPHQVALVLTADCLPILLCDQKASCIAAIHAGWRGLAAGIIQRAVEKLKCDPSSLMAWLGPAIGPTAFEVGQEVKEAFSLAGDEKAFKALTSTSGKTSGKTSGQTPGKWLADLYILARLRLAHLGIQNIYGGEYCTFKEEDKFFSYRRANPTGRQATIIWLEPE